MDKEPYVVVEIKGIIWLSKLTPGPSEMFSTMDGLYPFVTDFVCRGIYGELIKDIKPITKIDKHSFA